MLKELLETSFEEISIILGGFLSSKGIPKNQCFVSYAWEASEERKLHFDQKKRRLVKTLENLAILHTDTG